MPLSSPPKLHSTQINLAHPQHECHRVRDSLRLPAPSEAPHNLPVSECTIRLSLHPSRPDSSPFSSQYTSHGPPPRSCDPALPPSVQLVYTSMIMGSVVNFLGQRIALIAGCGVAGLALCSLPFVALLQLPRTPSGCSDLVEACDNQAGSGASSEGSGGAPSSASPYTRHQPHHSEHHDLHQDPALSQLITTPTAPLHSRIPSSLHLPNTSSHRSAPDLKYILRRRSVRPRAAHHCMRTPLLIR